MTTSKITRRWMEHSAGSKFYQIIRVTRGTKAVTAFHYAGYRGDHTRFRRPCNGGQVEIKAGDHLRAKTVEKEKRKSTGHYFIVTDDREETCRNDALLEVGLVTFFGARHAHQMLTELGVHVPSIKPIDESDTEESDESDTEVIEDEESEPVKPAARAASWASW